MLAGEIYTLCETRKKFCGISLYGCPSNSRVEVQRWGTYQHDILHQCRDMTINQ